MARFRSVPSAVHDSPEWAEATALARLAHRCLRPSAGKLVLVQGREDEEPWEQFQRKAAECGAFFDAAESQRIVQDCTACKLWQVDNGILVIAAFPPSFEEERVDKVLGPKGGKPRAEIQKNYRLRKKGLTAASEAPPAAPTPVTGVTGNASEKLPPLSSLSPSGDSSGRIPQRERQEEESTPSLPARSVTAPDDEPLRSAAQLAALTDRAAGELVVAWLADRLKDNFTWLAAVEKVDALGQCAKRFASTRGMSEESIATMAAFGAADIKAFRAVFSWASSVKRGKEPVSVGLLIGGRNADGTYKGTGMEALLAPTAAFAESLRSSGKTVSVRRPGPMRTGMPSIGIRVRNTPGGRDGR